VRTPLPVIKLLSTAYEICPDTVVDATLVCPICQERFPLSEDFALSRYATHFARLWDTHKPDFITKDGDAVQIVRRL
jgi:hypothetical protein